MRSTALHHWRLKHMHTALAAWTHHMQRRKHLRALAGKAVKLWQSSVLHAAFTAWEDHVQRRKEGRGKAVAALKHWREGTLSAALTAWAMWAPERARRRQRSAAVISRWRGSVISAAFTAWAGWAPPAARRRRMATLALTRLGNRQLSMAFRTWHLKATEAADERQVTCWHLQSGVGLHMAITFATPDNCQALTCYWPCNLSQAGAVPNAILENLSNFEGHDALESILASDQWCASQVVSLVIHRMRASCLFRAFGSWHDRSNHKMAVKQRLAQAVTALSKGLVQRCWASWLDFVNTRLAARRRMHSAVAHWMKHIAMACFKRWKEQSVAVRAAHQKGRDILVRITSYLKASPESTRLMDGCRCTQLKIEVGRGAVANSKGHEEGVHYFWLLWHRGRLGTAGGIM